jgi:hypothetical protein
LLQLLNETRVKQAASLLRNAYHFDAILSLPTVFDDSSKLCNITVMSIKKLFTVTPSHIQYPSLHDDACPANAKPKVQTIPALLVS